MVKRKKKKLSNISKPPRTAQKYQRTLNIAHRFNVYKRNEKRLQLLFYNRQTKTKTKYINVCVQCTRTIPFVTYLNSYIVQ